MEVILSKTCFGQRWICWRSGWSFSEVAISFENRILKANQADIQNLRVYFSQSIYYAWLKHRKLNFKLNSLDEFQEVPFEFNDNLRSVELTSILDEILNELSEKCKEILKLFAEGFSMKLIAEKFNFSSDTKAKRKIWMSNQIKEIYWK